jgi:hypothetical protein
MRGCILYLLPADKLWLDGKLERAQRHALKEQLPLAAVTCIIPELYQEKLPSLQTLEGMLGRYNLPFLVLIGSEAETLPTLVKHVRPVHVYGHGGGRENIADKLQNHPYEWPGTVINTEQLKKMVDKNNHMC